MSSIDGGDFGSGFAAGAVSSLVSSGVQGLGMSRGQPNKFGQSDWYNAATIAAGGLSGGISSTIAGGSFWSGARQGLITSGFNHVAHSTIQRIKYNSFVSKIDESISEQGLNPEDTVISEEYSYMRKFTESNKVLSKLLNKANKTFHVLFRDVFDYPKGGYDSYDTKRFVYITKAGKGPTGNSFEIGHASVNHRVVSIYKSAFLNNRELALAIGSGLKFHGFFNSYNSVLSIKIFQDYHIKTKKWYYEYSH